MAKILAIDDEVGILDVITSVLHCKGHEVIRAGNSRLGMQLFRQERPHVTILDLLMPDIGGMTVLKDIRALDPQAPVIILTGHATEERERQALQLGAADVLDKSLALDTLGATLDRVLTQVARTMMAHNRRQVGRFLMQFPVSFLRDGACIGEGTGCDLSVKGCRVTSQPNLNTGDQVKLMLYLHHDSEPTLALAVEQAVVRWRVDQQCGLEFSRLPSEDELRLFRYVEALPTPAP